jgi:hypothetical protein
MSTPRQPQEDDSLPGWTLLGVLLALVLVGIGLGFWAWGQERAREAALRPSGRWPERWLAPPARISNVLQTVYAGQAQYPRLVVEQRATLARWTWVDRPRGLVRVPVERAIDLYVAKAAAP